MQFQFFICTLYRQKNRSTQRLPLGKNSDNTRHSHAVRVLYDFDKDGVLEIWLGDTAYALYIISKPRPNASYQTLLFLAFVKGRMDGELMKAVVKLELTTGEIYKLLWSFSPFHKELGKAVPSVSYGIVMFFA